MATEDRFVLTDLPSDDSEKGLVTSRVHRCRGCAKCISTGLGECAIEDPFSVMISDILTSDVLEIHTGISDSQFSMPMRKAVERLSNVLQAYTDAGHNDPLDKTGTALRTVIVRVHGKPEDGFEDYAKDLLLRGPVESIRFSYE